MNSVELMDIVNSSISASIEVINQMTGMQVERGEIEKIYDSVISCGVITILGITGLRKGRILLNISSETAKAIALKINDEEEKYEYIDDTVLYSLTELTSIICGKMITMINNKFKEYNLRLTPPGVFCGEGIEITSSGFQALSIRMKTNAGDIDVIISFEGVKI